MAWLEGLLGGFQSRKAEIEAQNLDEARRAADRESRVYEALINSPDPEIKSAAITGLLTSTQPMKRKGGLRGWLGEMTANPAYARIQELINTPVETDETTSTLPSRQTSGMISGVVPTGGEQGALPSTSPTQVGAPPPTPVEPMPSALSSTLTTRESPTVQTTRRVSKPRQVFRTPEEQTLLTRKASAQGNVEGEVAGLVASGIPEAEARNLIAAKYRRLAGGTAPFQAIAGEVINEDGTSSPAYAVFNRATASWEDISGEPLTNFRPRPQGAGAVRFGVGREALAREMFGKDFKDLDQTQAAAVMAKEREEQGEAARRRAGGTERGQFEAPIDIPTAQRTGVPVGTSAAEVAGQKVPTVAQGDRRRSVTALQQQLTDIKTRLLAVLPSNADLIGGIAPGLVLMEKRRDPRYRNQVAALESAVNNIVNVAARAVGEQRGTQTEQDADRAYQGIVALRDQLLNGDTRESAGVRIDETLGYLEKILGLIPEAPVPGAVAPGVGAPPPASAAPQQGRSAIVPGVYVDLTTGQLTTQPTP